MLNLCGGRSGFDGLPSLIIAEARVYFCALAHSMDTAPSDAPRAGFTLGSPW